MMMLTSAIQLGAKPSKIELIINPKETICTNLTLLSNYNNLQINIEDKWSDKETKNIADYKLSSNNVNIKIDYPKKIIFSNESQLNLCFKPEKSKLYYGVLILRTDNSAGLGIWLKINSLSQTQNQANSLITSQTIINSENFFKNGVIIPIAIITIILLLILVSLIKSFTKKK